MKLTNLDYIRNCFIWSRKISILRVIIFSVVLSVFITPPLSLAQTGKQVSENALKAVYLYNFLYFIHKQNGEPADANVPFKIIVLGDSLIGKALFSLQEDLKETGRRGIEVVHYRSFQEIKNVDDGHLLFVSRSERKRFNNIIGKIKSKPILTVSDCDGFIEAGGMIRLIITDKQKVRWEINRSPFNQAGLKVSAKLLKIAVRVVDSPTSLWIETWGRALS